MSIDTVSYALIFGGCCTNVFTLEGIVKKEADSGLLITTTQLITTALLTLPTQFDYHTTLPSNTKRSNSHPYTNNNPQPSNRIISFRHPSIPFIRLTISSALFVLVNLLNNWAFAFQISVPLHIILRSFGSVITMLVGYVLGRRYTSIQVLGVMGLTGGVVVAAWADASAKGADLSLTPSSSSSKVGGGETASFAAGLLVLLVAQILGAVMGVYTEETYKIYGRHWRENLFYTHFIGSVLSLALAPTLLLQLQRLLVGPKITLDLDFYVEKLPGSLKEPAIILREHLPPSILQHKLTNLWLPSQSLALLAANALTQYLCISGVNRLSATTSAVTVTVVLNVRKLASFMLSCLFFGNEMSGLMVLGAGIVFVSGGIYGVGGALKGRGRRDGNEKGKEEKEKDWDGRVDGEFVRAKIDDRGYKGVDGSLMSRMESPRTSPMSSNGTAVSSGARLLPDGTMVRR